MVKTEEDLLKKLNTLLKENPNNMDLGAKVRSLVNKMNSNLTTNDQPDNQLTMFCETHSYELNDEFYQEYTVRSNGVTTGSLTIVSESGKSKEEKKNSK